MDERTEFVATRGGAIFICLAISLSVWVVLGAVVFVMAR